LNVMNAYKDHTPSSSIKSPRDSEIEVILFITRSLKKSEVLKKENYARFVWSIQSNRKLWALLSRDVAHIDNALPNEIKAKILYLGNFVQQYSRKVLKEELTIIPLIDINLAILRGLNDQGAGK